MLKETKLTQQLNTISDPRLDLVLENNYKACHCDNG